VAGEYEKKRDFSRTPEPSLGPSVGGQGPLAFVVQKHSARRLHYDLRLEVGGALKSWAVPSGPSPDPAVKRLAVMVEDHPLEYRSFEGVIPQGEYGAGQVIVWDEGTYSPDEDGRLSFDDRKEAEERVKHGLRSGKLSLLLRGHRLKGSWTLVKMRQKGNNWLLIKHRDEYARPGGDLLKEAGSVISGLSIDDLKAGKKPANPGPATISPKDIPGALRAPLPEAMAPMLATAAELPLHGSGWLLEKRQQKVRPGRDEKVLASWNGLMLASLAEAACALNRRDYLAAASANGRFLLDAMMSEGRLKHSYKDGEARIDGYLDDYALVIEGLLSLHLATFGGRWLTQAVKLAEVMVDEFWDKKEETFYDTGRGQEELFVRPRSTYDGVLPSAGSAAAMALLKLSRLTGNQEWQRLAVQSLRSVRELMQRHPLGFANWLSALDFYLSRPVEIAIIGPRDDPATGGLLKTICSTWLPSKVAAARDPGESAPAELPLLESRAMVDGKPAVYVCRDYACKAPITDPAKLSAELSG